MTITLNGTTGIVGPNGSASTPAMTGTDTDSGIVYGTNTVQIATGGATAVTVDSSQNVGIGTSSPAQKLDIASGGKAYFRRADNGTGGTIHNGGAGSGGLIFNELNSEGFAWQLGSTEKMRIDSSGNLLIGRTSNPWSAKLLIESTSAGANFRTTSSTSTAVEIDVNSSGTTQKALEVYSDSNNERSLTIWSNGNVVNKLNSYGAISDVKLKENIADATPKLEQLCQVKVRNYNLIGDTTKQLGVVAQELEQIFPSMIDESVDRDSEGNDLGTTTKSVKYSVFVPMLIKAIQEQQAIITDLKARIETLESK